MGLLPGVVLLLWPFFCRSSSSSPPSSSAGCQSSSFCAQVNDDDELTLIDFPQMVSTSHANAQELFERDVECVLR